MSDVVKEISYRWSQMSTRQKAPYFKMAQEDKIRYENEMKPFRETKASKSIKKSVPEFDNLNNLEKSETPNQTLKPTCNSLSLLIIVIYMFSKTRVNI